MRQCLSICLFAAVTTASFSAKAIDSTMTGAGYTGLGITPNAHLLDWGRFEATYENQLSGVVRDTSGHNFVGSFGLFPNLELSGRLATNSLNRNCFTEGCGTRDLSASVKFGIGLDTANRYRIAVGGADVGGSVPHFRTYYGVLTYNQGPLEGSVGLAKRSNNGINGSRSPLDGPFAGVAWQLLPWLRGHVEYADSNAWAGVRMLSPKQWLPEGWQAYVGVNQRLTNSPVTRKAWVTAGVSIPLYKVPDLPGGGAKAALPALASGQLPMPAYEARSLPPAPVATPPTSAQSEKQPATTVTDGQLEELAVALQAKGLEDISVGRMPDRTIAVLANNATYNWNSADALGAALGAVARKLGTSTTGYRLVLTQRQVPLVAVTGQADCLARWVADSNAPCTAGQLSTPGTGTLESLLAGVQWAVQGRQPSWRTARVSFSPVLRTSIGTEFGAFDYALGVNVGVLQPLWHGASIEWRANLPLANSSDYAPEGVFGPRRIRAETERLAFVQTVRVPLERWLAPGSDLQALRWGLGGLTAQATIGRVGGDFDGVHGALRWEPGEGRHRLTGQAGLFRNAEFGHAGTPAPTLRTAKPLLASYRYNVTPTRTFVEATAGQFMNNDRGFQLGARQWFSDVAVNAYFRRSAYRDSVARNFIGLEISLPLGPRRDMAPRGPVQLTGTPRFSHAIESTVREIGSNPLRPGYGLLPPVPTLDAVFNSDRAGLVYFEDNIRRIRDAAR
ncbi:YjbH domain-containing protein [Caenimonas terrae]|uniref:YjbH domain-containing protein n=1 Tax=Caenimonas terrae TaxID=696074 RepID=A0ABW0NEL8_9BURK